MELLLGGHRRVHYYKHQVFRDGFDDVDGVLIQNHAPTGGGSAGAWSDPGASFALSVVLGSDIAETANITNMTILTASYVAAPLGNYFKLVIEWQRNGPNSIVGLYAANADKSKQWQFDTNGSFRLLVKNGTWANVGTTPFTINTYDYCRIVAFQEGTRLRGTIYNLTAGTQAGISYTLAANVSRSFLGLRCYQNYGELIQNVEAYV
jgi:hypothetical protein